MKRLVLYFVLITLAVANAACSSDDKKEEEQKELTLVSDAQGGKVAPGSSVLFSAMEGEGEDLVEVKTGVSFYLDEKEIGNRHVFEEIGEFKIIAKKKGYTDSNVLVIKVVDEVITVPKDVLTIRVVGGVTEVELGEVIHFEVKGKGDVAVEDADIQLSDDTKIGYSWTPAAVGTYKVKAKKEGYTTSVALEIQVKEKVEKELVLALKTSAEHLYLNEDFELTIKDEDGGGVVGAILYKDGVATNMVSVDGVFRVRMDAVGTYALKAVKNNLESNVVRIKVAKREMGPANSFLFKGDTYSVSSSYLFFVGIEDAEGEFIAVWQLEAKDATGVTAGVLFYTSATLEDPSESVFSYELPIAGNTMPMAVGVMRNNVVLAEAVDDIEFMFDAEPNGTLYIGDYYANAPRVGGNAFALNYEGITSYFNTSGARIQTISTRSAQVNPRIKVSQAKPVTKGLRTLSR
ncbi:hypothetical protein [Myroides fluvii]|uniref:hypothetical protein n=1 Tax=Myroides fluvii TaxID=2572594 RepID=UPI00131ECD10|nr:hypothetical protein [Myroides fluvii]